MDHPYREPLFYGTDEHNEDEQDLKRLKAELLALKLRCSHAERGLYDMTRDRDGWQQEAELLREVVVIRDREIDRLKKLNSP